MNGADARADGFGKIPEQGCPMSHCDPQMSDQVNLDPPTGAVKIAWQNSTTTRGETGGTDGLGCVGDGVMAFCTYRADIDQIDPLGNPMGNLVAYDYNGLSPWNSKNQLNQAAFASMPVIRTGGNVIAADNLRIIEFNRLNGAMVWDQDLDAGGTPTGPLITQNGGIVFATLNGPVYLYDGNSLTGDPRGSLLIQDTIGSTCFSGTGIFDSNNVAASAAGNIVYVNARCREQSGPLDTNDLAWIARLDVDPAELGSGLTLKPYQFVFKGPSFASPLIVDNDIYFDGLSPVDAGTFIYKIRDTGTSFVQQERIQVSTSPRASFALDPRPGPGPVTGTFWHPIYNKVVRRSLDTLLKIPDEEIDVEALIDDSTFVWSRVGVLTMAGNATSPVLLTSATQFMDKITYVVAIDLMTGQLLWKVKFKDEEPPVRAYDRVLSQFPILTNDGVDPPRVIFTGGVGNAPGGVYAFELVP